MVSYVRQLTPLGYDDTPPNNLSRRQTYGDDASSKHLRRRLGAGHARAVELTFRGLRSYRAHGARSRSGFSHDGEKPWIQETFHQAGPSIAAEAAPTDFAGFSTDFIKPLYVAFSGDEEEPWIKVEAQGIRPLARGPSSLFG